MDGHLNFESKLLTFELGLANLLAAFFAYTFIGLYRILFQPTEPFYPLVGGLQYAYCSSETVDHNLAHHFF